MRLKKFTSRDGAVKAKEDTLKDKDEWTQEDINSRTDKLAKLALELFQF